MTDEYDSYEWDYETQRAILSTFLKNRTMLLSGKIVKPEYFTYEPLEHLATAAVEYSQKYKKVPTRNAFMQCVEGYLKNSNINKRDREQMTDLAMHCMTDTDYDYELINDLAFEFADTQNIKESMDEALTYLRTGDVNRARSILDSVGRTSKASLTAEETLDYLIKTERAPKGSRLRYKTGIKGIDLITGGIRPKQYGVIVGPSGAWKTGWSVTMAKGYVVNQGLNILYVSTEQSQHDIQCLFDVAMVPGLTQDKRMDAKFSEAKQYRKQVKRLTRKKGGRLFIKYFPYKSASMADVHGLIEALNSKLPERETIDGIIVDAADGFSAYGSKDQWENEYASYASLERMVGELDIFAWSTCQVRKEDIDTYITSMKNLRGRAEKAQLASVIMAINNLKTHRRATSKKVNSVRYGFLCCPKTRNTMDENWSAFKIDTAQMKAEAPSAKAETMVIELLGEDDE